MRLGGPEHFKTKRLAKALEITRPQAVGTLEMLWHLAAKFTPQGDIGKLTDQEIADEVDWAGDSANLIEALVSCGMNGCGYLEHHEEHRLIIHDWEEHCPSYIRKKLKRNDLEFVQPMPGQWKPTDQSVPSQRPPKSGPSPPLPSPSPPSPSSPSMPAKSAGTAYTPGFTATWKAYPKSRRTAKQKCFEYWKRDQLESRAAEILEKLEAFKETKDWKDGYYPGMTKWFYQRYWDKELDEICDPDAAPTNTGNPSQEYMDYVRNNA